MVLAVVVLFTLVSVLCEMARGIGTGVVVGLGMSGVKGLVMVSGLGVVV